MDGLDDFEALRFRGPLDFEVLRAARGVASTATSVTLKKSSNHALASAIAAWAGAPPATAVPPGSPPSAAPAPAPAPAAAAAAAAAPVPTPGAGAAPDSSPSSGCKASSCLCSSSAAISARASRMPAACAASNALVPPSAAAPAVSVTRISEDGKNFESQLFIKLLFCVSTRFTFESILRRCFS